MTKKAGREWRVEQSVLNDSACVAIGPMVGSNEHVHVIEYAAYEALERELAEAKAEATSLGLTYRDDLEREYQSQLMKLRAELAEAKADLKVLVDNKSDLDLMNHKLRKQSAALVEALKKIKSLAGLDSSAFGPRVVETADEALKKYGGGE